MMIFPISTYGADILRQKTEDIDMNDVLLPSLVDDMFETMHNANGAGLAGPQVGLNKRMIVVEEEISDGEIFKGVFINTNILNYSGHLVYMIEGCLSFPELQIEVPRPLTIEVEWYDENKKYHKEFFMGIKSRILQHEIDHLNGVLFIDRIDPEDKLKIFMKLEDIKNKNFNVNYSTK